MYKICVFAGTSEGRRLIEFLAEQDAEVTACVATEYGEELIEAKPNVNVIARRMDSQQMRELFLKSRFDLVIDATHPYADIVTENIVLACRSACLDYLRLERREADSPSDAVTVPDVSSAVEHLNRTEGNILLTTGSKELAAFSALSDFSERVYARVLPTEDSIELCKRARLAPSHIIAMQGPFSVGMNTATLKAVNASYMVTKESGKAGGFNEKVLAAKRSGARLVVIGRPSVELKSGLDFSQTLEMLFERFGFKRRAEVTILGIGPGSRESMTLEAQRAVDSADCIIGAERMLELAAGKDQTRLKAIAPDAIAEFIFSHNEFSRFAVVMSGDTGFFSGTKKLLPMLSECRVRVLPGISSLSYLCSKCGLSYEDTLTVSAHGRALDIAELVRSNRSVFVLTDASNTPDHLLSELVKSGLGDVRCFVGESMSYPDERITGGTAEELFDKSYKSLSSLIIINENAAERKRSAFNVCKPATIGLSDALFQRGGDAQPVPMTKSEVRAVCLSKLTLDESAVCYDIGAGTGSVAIEMALAARRGTVYAIEKRTDAVELIRHNSTKFGTDNLIAISGPAPEALSALPPPTHAFIGGSSGNMSEIMRALLMKNPAVRIVATAVALETISELTACVKAFCFAEAEVVSIAVAKNRPVGGYNIMTGQNPIHIFTLSGGRAE